MPNPKLKYLFTAYYKDGTRYEQNTDDISVKDPIRSCFYDIDHEKLTSFELKDSFNNSWTIFLTDGHFEFHNDFGSAIIPPPPQTLTNFRLIFYRTHEARTDTGEDRIVCYKLGFQANVVPNTYDGETGRRLPNVQVILELY